MTDTRNHARNRMTRWINDLSGMEAREILGDVVRNLYWDRETLRWDADKEWDADTLEAIGHVLAVRGLRPTY